MPKETNQTYDYICFTDLVYEFQPAQQKAIETKLKRRLKYHKLGAYNQARVDYIRKLKNELCAEITAASASKYYTASESGFAEMRDFNTALMNAEYGAKYTEIDADELSAMIGFAIYSYYLR